MQYTKLGNSQLQVSRICMGCMGFGDAKMASTAGPLMKSMPGRSSGRGWNRASTFSIPPSPTRAVPASNILGRALRDFAKREEVVVATKIPAPHTGRDRRRHHRPAACGANDRHQLEKTWAWIMWNLYIYHMWELRHPPL